MDRLDHERMQQWLDEALDGELEPVWSRQLEAHLEECSACRQEKELSLRLRNLLAEDRVAVAPGFAARVTAALPVEAWQVRSLSSFRAAVALLLLLGASAVLLLSTAGGSSPFGLLASVVDLFASAALAGAGLLGASWQGLGLVLRDLLTSSPATLVAFVGALVAVNLLVWRLIRSRRPATASTRNGDAPPAD